jgi:hypothetical protein
VSNVGRQVRHLSAEDPMQDDGVQRDDGVKPDDGVQFHEPLMRRGGTRVGIALSVALLVVLGAVATMAASPAPSSSPSGGTSTDPAVPGLNGLLHGIAAGLPGGFAAGQPGSFGAFADRGFGGFREITITAIDGSNLSLKTDDGWTRTITVTSDTTIRKGGQAATLADLKVGDQIRFAQRHNDDGSWTVTAIQVVQPTVAGTVTAVTSGGFTITDRSGLSRSVTTSSSTTYRLGEAAGTAADVKVGSRIVATGEPGSNNSFNATTVVIAQPKVAGSVTAKGTNSFTLQRRDGTTITVHVDADTTWRLPGATNPGLDDLTVGMRVGAVGTQNADGSIDASTVVGGRGRGLWDKGRGRDQAPDQAAPSPSPSGTTG